MYSHSVAHLMTWPWFLFDIWLLTQLIWHLVKNKNYLNDIKDQFELLKSKTSMMIKQNKMQILIAVLCQTIFFARGISVLGINGPRKYHIRMNHLVIGWHTFECNIWFRVRSHKSVTFGFGLNHIKLQHFTCKIILKCCSLMWSNPRPSVTL